jgi:hypothetical protein
MMWVIFLRRTSTYGISSFTSSMRAMKTWSSIASDSVSAERVKGSKLSTMSSLGFVSLYDGGGWEART